ncbi:UDP-N-acetylglucosamine 2-epimerase [Pedobacter miscanthi]|uniref:UDP-N-acetylglucosamine 2-epimerase n=1 Tax=Pedobacter miscanthi TaxID=2259170 RepID=UPI00292DA40E|nr:UDP-N-acetylglucosamine 2-epimerase [Pedobacter miscanthi]
MKIGLLTSSRADFGIYLPLLKELVKDDFFELKIIAFGTHLSDFHGKTINQIENLGFNVSYTIESMLLTDSASSISTAIGLTTIKFADFWNKHSDSFELVFCLGDRYEMFAAVTAGIPFQIPFAHIHGGETTIGAIDNVFRHSITLASKCHFVSTQNHAKRVAQITGSEENIFDIGALSLDNLNDITLLSIKEFKSKWGIDLSLPTMLTTFHPETVAAEQNSHYAGQLVETLANLADYQVLVTMPNADTSGNIVRKALIDNFSNNKRVFLIENLGTQSYFSAMKYCSFLLGNTSSGIIEAASFNKYVINLGDRQKGRTAGGNIIHVPIDSSKIIEAVNKIGQDNSYTGENIYYKRNSAKLITNIVKNYESYR